MNNFSFKHEGKTYWYSRSVTAVNYIFAKDKKGVWCILACERGNGAASHQGYFNAPCGYLDFNEWLSPQKLPDACHVSDKESYVDVMREGMGAVQRETFEECGLRIDEKYMHFLHLHSNPHTSTQNVDCAFYTILPETTDVYEKMLTTKYSEPDEVAQIKFMSIDEAKSQVWAFEQLPVIELIYKTYVNPPFWNKLMLKLSEYIDRKYKLPFMV